MWLDGGDRHRTTEPDLTGVDSQTCAPPATNLDVALRLEVAHHRLKNQPIAYPIVGIVRVISPRSAMHALFLSFTGQDRKLAKELALFLLMQLDTR